MRSPYKAGDLITQDTWYNPNVNNVGLVVCEEVQGIALVLWREPERYGARLVWTCFNDDWDRGGLMWDDIPEPKVTASETYLVHRGPAIRR